MQGDQSDYPPRAGRERTGLTELVAKQRLPGGGVVPQDDTVVDYDPVGRSLFELPADTPALTAIRFFAQGLQREEN